MSIKIDAGKYGRGDLFRISPEYILVADNLNGRWLPHDDEAIESLVANFELPNSEGRPRGQLQPVSVRRLEDNKVQLVAGYRRYRAVARYNEKHPEAPMQLECKVVVQNDEDAFSTNISENRERKATSTIDDAFNQQRLRDAFGWTDARIADLYGKTPGYVNQCKKLLKLPADIQMQVHRGEKSMVSALALADLTEDGMRVALKEAEKSGGGTNAVKAAVRKAKNDDGKKVGRNLTEVRQYFERITADARQAPGLIKLAATMIGFMKGGFDEAFMTAALKDVLGLPVAVTAEMPVPETVTITVNPAELVPAAA